MTDTPDTPQGPREWLVEDLGYDGLWLSPADKGKSFNRDECPLLVVDASAYEKVRAEMDELRIIAMGQTASYPTELEESVKEIAHLRAEVERLKKILAQEFSENDELGAEYLGITMVRDENRQLRLSLAEAVSALEFYYDRENWNITDPSGFAGFINSNDFDEYDFGGKRARNTLATLKLRHKDLGEG